MTYFPKLVEQESKPFQCPGCKDWYVPNPAMRNVSCCVYHGPGTCCHYSETRVPTPPSLSVLPGQTDYVADA